ncbi:peptide deformylase [Chitinivibrio alkaliphilus]|uniref:Peptide deformylase n=1 Tax=Chitinivibrio alkaliphilus ACht1 TaxID=1313304 RepID=U7D652_9BACT|nr:peptide deformylase [Chitinivibrio alkaliphilus]ERP31413.1 peptide deformylase [Chitinivibrio alkaliphilus ACht1]
MRRLRYYGDAILREKAAMVETFSGETQEFAEELVELMYEYDGVGLAAPQVGVSLQMIAVDVWDGEQDPVVLVNPRITWASEEKDWDAEGCLSIPGITAPVERATSITVSAFTPHGDPLVLESVEGFFARALQHEIDHLRGILFVDLTTPAKKALLKNKLKKLSRAYQKNT